MIVYFKISIVLYFYRKNMNKLNDYLFQEIHRYAKYVDSE